MFTSKDLALLKMIVSEEINYIKSDEYLDRDAYIKQLKKIDNMLRPYRVKALTNDMKKLIVLLITMKIEVLNIEIEAFADDFLISTLGDALGIGEESELTLDCRRGEFNSEELECLEVDISEEQAEIVAMYIMKREYENLLSKFTS